jgi:hypothetical protein
MMAVAAAGCGSSGSAGPVTSPTRTAAATLTKAQVIAQGSTICKAAEHGLSRLPQITTPHPFAPGTSRRTRVDARRFLAGYADLLAGSVRGLQQLAAPAAGRDLLVRYFDGANTAVEQLRTASHAPADQVEADAQHAFATFAHASRWTRTYGFGPGVCGAGSSG